MESQDRVVSRRGLAEWAALGGVVYVVLFIVGCWLLFESAPPGDDSPASFISYFSDSGHRDQVSFGWIVAGVGLLFLLFFIASLRETVSRFGGSILATLTTLGGGIYVTLALAAFALDSAVKTMSDDTYQHRVYPELIHAADDASYVIHASGGAALGVMILAASIAFIRSGVVPKWAGWLGIPAVIAAVATIAFVTVFVWLLWILIVAIVLFWKGNSHNGRRRSTTCKQTVKKEDRIVSIVVRFNPTSVTKEKYDETITRLETAGDWPPDGLAYHIFFGPDDDLRVSEIWDSQEQFAAFGERLMPILSEVGIGFDSPPEIQEVHNIIQR